MQRAVIRMGSNITCGLWIETKYGAQCNRHGQICWETGLIDVVFREHAELGTSRIDTCGLVGEGRGAGNSPRSSFRGREATP